MTLQEHALTARDFLDRAEQYLAEGDRLQCSEKLWGAACHALSVVAAERGWKDTSHRDMRNAVDRLAAEFNDPNILVGYLAAQTFHRNFYHGFLDYHEIEADRPLVQDFVDRILTLADQGPSE